MIKMAFQVRERKILKEAIHPDGKSQEQLRGKSRQHFFGDAHSGEGRACTRTGLLEIKLDEKRQNPNSRSGLLMNWSRVREVTIKNQDLGRKFEDLSKYCHAQLEKDTRRKSM